MRGLARAEIARGALTLASDRRAEEIARLEADVAAARSHRAEIDRLPALQTAPAGRTCAGKHGSWNCGGAVQAEAVRANAGAQKAHGGRTSSGHARV